MPIHLLIVEDEQALQELLKFSLGQAGFSIELASSAEEAQQRITARLPDLVILDWMLPGQSGSAFARQLRQHPRSKGLPIILLTAKASEADKIEGLEQGADDYMTKPFSPRELVARIKALLRRRAPEHDTAILKIGPLELNPNTYRVTYQEHPIHLGPIEFRLLQFLMAHTERVHTRTQLLDQVWGDHIFVEERTIDVHIRRLRRALEPYQGESLIQTVRGAGYRVAVSEGESNCKEDAKR